MAVQSICGVIIAAKDPEALARFYSDALELHFEREDHGGLDVHFGADVGQMHFGIHPASNVHNRPTGRGSTSIAFNVDAMAPVLKRLKELGAKELAPPHDEGFGPVAAYQDFEGNQFEIVELKYDFGA